MLTVPTTAPGFDYTVVHTMSGVDTSATYYSDVRVPRSSLVGEEGRGWALVTNQLNNERVALCSAAPIQIALGETIAWARESGVIEQQWVRTNRARVHAKVEFLKLINWKIASAVGSGSAPSASGPTFSRKLPPLATTLTSRWTSSRVDLYRSSGLYDHWVAIVMQVSQT